MEPPNSTTTASEITAAKIEVPDFELPVLPSEWRRVPTATIEELLQLARWNDPEHLRRRVAEFKGQIAAIIFEPVLCNTCVIEPAPGLMATIRELCDRDGMLMISDETITGFRFGGSCAQG